GDKLIAAANRYAAGIAEIGGAEKLTANERDRANATIDKAIEKYEALGREAPTALKQLQEETRNAGKELDNLASSLTDLGSSLKAVGTTMTAMISAPIVGAAAAATHFAADFQTNMVRVQTLAGASAQEVQKLSGEVLKLAPEVGVGPAELAKGLF